MKFHINKTRMMKRYLITYAYIGSNFRGVQKQVTLEDKFKPDPQSVQGILEISLCRFKPVNYPTVCVSSRTDRGVHALETTAHVDLELPKCKPLFLHHGMNRYFNKAKVDIWVKNVKIVPESFHARYSAKSRTYLYRLAVKKADSCPDKRSKYTESIPIGEWKRCCFIENPVFYIDKLKEAASFFPGLKNFRTFTGLVSHKPENYSTVRRINELTVTSGQPFIKSIHDTSNELYDFWDIRVNAKSFVYRQVRRMVGVLIAVAQDKISVEEVRRMIDDPMNNGWNSRASTAPPHALYLVRVEYDPEDLNFPNGIAGEAACEACHDIRNGSESLKNHLVDLLKKIGIRQSSSMSLLKAIASKKNNLRHCKTVVTTQLGESLLEDIETGCVTRIPDAQLSPGYVVDLCPDMQMAEVIPNLYLGSQDPTADEKLLCASGITHILSLGVKPLNLCDEHFEKMCIAEMEVTVLSHCNMIVKFVPLLDVPEASLNETLVHCFTFIDEALSTNGRIFVHCNAGVSRSPSVVIAYILYRSHLRKPWAFIPLKSEVDDPLTLSDVTELVRNARPCIKPNPGFVKQLAEYESRLCNGDFS